MKKPKMKLDAAKIQAFFLNHIEKILLVGVVGLMLLLIWQGLNQTGAAPNQKQGALLTNSASMRTFIDDPNRWKEIESEREKQIDRNMPEKVMVGQLATNAQQYFLPNPIKRADFPQLKPRTDPKLFAPIHLVVHPVIGPLAVLWKNDKEPDPLAVAATTSAQNRPAPKPLPPPKKKKNAEDMYNPDGGMPQPKKGKKGPMGSQAMGSDAAMGPAPGMGSASGSMGSAPGMEGSGMDLLTADANSFGFMPSNADGTLGRDTRAMVVTAVVPFEKQVEEFLNTLSLSLDFDPARDFPQYLTFYIDRADVTANPYADIAGVKWERLSVNKAHTEQLGDPSRNIIGDWAGAPTEVLDPAFLDQVIQGGKLTYPAPPFLQRDLWDLLTHPDVPLATQNLYGGGEGYGQPIPGVPGAGATDDSPLGIPTSAPGGMSGSDMPAPGFRAPGMGMGGMAGSSGMPMSGSRGSGGSAGPPSGMRQPMMSSDMSGGQPQMAPAKYKLIRFTDTTVQLNHKYRYRLKLFLNDPNHPALPNPTTQGGHLPPSVASLDDKVRTRIKQLDALDATKPKGATGVPYRTSWIESEWSEPSDVVELPQMGQILAHGVTQSTGAKFGNYILPNDQPKASAVVVKWDPQKAADIPAELEKVYRGTVFNFTQDLTKVIHPVTRQIIELAKEKFSTNVMVADLQGGEKITALDKVADHALVTPGEILTFDAAGNMHVQNEAMDIDTIRRIIIKKPDPATTTTGTDALAEGPGPPGSKSTRPPRPKAGCF